MSKKKLLPPGATESTPSHSQYFSWINSTNEGSTERQTLINLKYFEWLRNTYGMKLDIYAWDAGNLDGASGTYHSLDDPKIKAQYPNGYAPIVEAAEKIGTRMGLWCGPDGFGDTKESEAARHETMVSLCRDYNFALFKIDGVCGTLNARKRAAFDRMMTECRQYCPDLVLLNHRLELGAAAHHATTFLWNGVETYVDVHIRNDCTAPHHRAFMFHRGNVPGLQRLSEDHGVCLSSCMDYFEDDLIYQAFGRCLILAPEIYANPWLLRDYEQPRLARIYNLHRRYAPILVSGTLLPDSLGENAVSRGNESVRFITTGAADWNGMEIELSLDESIGLEKCEKVTAVIHHPFEELLGEFEWGEKLKVKTPAFRAMLIEVRDSAAKAPAMLSGCRYEVIREDENGEPIQVKIIASSGTVTYKGKKLRVGAFDNTPHEPVFLGEAKNAPVPENAELLYETARFGIDSDSLEMRSLRRAGETSIPEVKAARDEFFAQQTYKLRGCESAVMFDGDDSTFFDTCSKLAYGRGFRWKDGCLRVDLGKAVSADSVVIEYFNPDENHAEIIRQKAFRRADYSVDLVNWFDSYRGEEEIVNENELLPTVMERVHNIENIPGKRIRVTYPVNGKLRYFRLPKPVDRIFSFRVFKNGREIAVKTPHANNLLPHFKHQPPKGAKQLTVRVSAEDTKRGVFIAVALDGKHGVEGAVPVAKCGKKLYSFPDRACSYPSNAWECGSREADDFYTFYLPVTEEMADRDITVTVLKLNGRDYPVKLWLCDENREPDGVVKKL